MAKHIEELEERIGTVMKLLKEIRTAIGLGSDFALQGEFNITQAEGIIQRAQEALRVRLWLPGTGKCYSSDACFCVFQSAYLIVMIYGTMHIL